MTIAAIATILYRELAGLELGLPFPFAAAAMGLGITLFLTLLAALPAAIPLFRTPPRALLASRG
jgi:hypothetical protein